MCCIDPLRSPLRAAVPDALARLVLQTKTGPWARRSLLGALGVGAILRCGNFPHASAEEQTRDNAERDVVEDDPEEEADKENRPCGKLIHGLFYGLRRMRDQGAVNRSGFSN